MNNRKEAYINHCIKKRYKHIKSIAKKYLGHNCYATCFMSKKYISLSCMSKAERGFCYHIFVSQYNTNNSEDTWGMLVCLHKKIIYEEFMTDDWKKFSNALIKSGLTSFQIHFEDLSYYFNGQFKG